MGCLLIISAFAGPRIGIILWWLLDMQRWEDAFDEVFWPLMGFIFFPWTLLAFVIVAPKGILTDSDYIWLALAFALDLASIAGGLGRRYTP